MSRPRKLPENRKRHVKVVRLNDAMLDTLAAAAASNQRSLSEEIEYRLWRSIDGHSLGMEVATYVLCVLDKRALREAEEAMEGSDE